MLVITGGDHIVILTFNRKSSDRTHIVLSGMRSKFGNQHLLKKKTIAFNIPQFNWGVESIEEIWMAGHKQHHML